MADGELIAEYTIGKRRHVWRFDRPKDSSLIEGCRDNAKVAQLEAMLLQLPQVDLQTSHVVHGGMCARTILVPAGTALTGALTDIDNVCVMCGDITVTTDKGPVRLTGFHVLPAASGYKRAGMAHADTWWTTIWPTALTDIEAIEDEMTNEAGCLQTRRPAIEQQQQQQQHAEQLEQ